MNKTEASKRYWLLSNDKTVREISAKRMRELDRAGRNHKLVIVDNTRLCIWKGKNFMFLHRRQLDQIWKSKPIEKEPEIRRLIDEL